MRSSAESSNDSARKAVVRTLIALERSCLDADSALVARRWHDLEAAFTAQTRLTGELAKLFETAPDTMPVQDAKVARRVRGILAYREDQLRRLREYNAEIGERLQAILKLRGYARAVGKPSSRLIDAQY